MLFEQAITELIPARFSCRTYREEPLDADTIAQLSGRISAAQVGPLGNRARFALVAATEADAQALKGLGTYGFIKGAAGFFVGVLREGELNLEDFGYQMEQIILQATDLDLGTCWLGGTFAKSRFAAKVALQEGESIPAVTSVGYIAPRARRFDRKVRDVAASDHRLPWNKLFFSERFDNPLSQETAGDFAIPLAMVRRGPSASNRQPWRIIKTGTEWHFYLRRTRGYRTNNYAKLLKLADLQRVDMGIAMCHFELTALELGLNGSWRVNDPGLALPNEWTEYIISWKQN